MSLSCPGKGSVVPKTLVPYRGRAPDIGNPYDLRKRDVRWIREETAGVRK